MLDTVHPVETPEGVRLLLRAAGPTPRALAFALDVGLRSVFYVFVLVAVVIWVPGEGDLGIGLVLLIVFLGEWFYPVAFEMGARGQTPGKMALGLRVVHADGTRIRWSASILRNLLLAADWVPGTYAAGLISMLASGQFRRLGDLAAGTLVVHVDSPPGTAAEPPPVEPLAPPVALSVAEQRALVAFGERAPRLSDARADELASLAEPLLGGAEPPRTRLLRIGAWLRGRSEGKGASEGKAW